VSVSLRIDTRLTGLTIDLVSPDADVVVLADQRGDLGDDYGSGDVRTVFDDGRLPPSVPAIRLSSVPISRKLR